MLGNHDYANYVGNKWFGNVFSSRPPPNMLAHWTSVGSDGAAEYMMAQMKNIVAGSGPWSSFGGTDHYDVHSMAYAWSLPGTQRLIATHNYPTYIGLDCQTDPNTSCERELGKTLGDSMAFRRRALQ